MKCSRLIELYCIFNIAEASLATGVVEDSSSGSIIFERRVFHI